MEIEVARSRCNNMAYICLGNLYSTHGKLAVWIPGIPFWKGLLLQCTSIRIPNHRAPKAPIYYSYRIGDERYIYLQLVDFFMVNVHSGKLR